MRYVKRHDELGVQFGLKRTPYIRDEKKYPRNYSCPCGSGKKYKKCHLNTTQK